MSRNISTAKLHTDDMPLRDTTEGTLLFTSYRDKLCGLLCVGNRLIAAQVLQEEGNRIGAIYIGKVKNVVKNLAACFVEIAEGEICFLACKDAKAPILLNRKYDGRILQGDELLVQISREAQKTKQASVTADISISNEYGAFTVGAAGIGYSNKLTGLKKAALKALLPETELMNELRSQTNLGLVIRTKAGECTEEVLLQKLQALYEELQFLIQTAAHRTCFTCVRQAPEDFETVLDKLAYPYEYNEIITDNATLLSNLETYCNEHLPDKKVRLYEDADFDLSKLYSLEQKMDTALNARIWLKSGGYLVIEHTEALTVIDVNSGKYEPRGASQNRNASSAVNLVNREAAEEIALQLRLRNLSGIILVDFINMNSKEAEEELLEIMRNLVRKDKVKTTVIDMTALGLMEITRKKQNKPLREQFYKQERK